MERLLQRRILAEESSAFVTVLFLCGIKPRHIHIEHEEHSKATNKTIYIYIKHHFLLNLTTPPASPSTSLAAKVSLCFSSIDRSCCCNWPAASSKALWDSWKWLGWFGSCQVGRVPLNKINNTRNTMKYSNSCVWMCLIKQSYILFPF